MIKSIVLFLAFYSFQCICLAGDADSNSKWRLYEKMSAINFLNLVDICEYKMDEKDKNVLLRDGALTAFAYWVRTRKGDVKESKAEDASLKLFYKKIKDAGRVEIFSDPLRRNALKEPELVGVSEFKQTITKVLYSEYVQEFIEFLKNDKQIRQP